MFTEEKNQQIIKQLEYILLVYLYFQLLSYTNMDIIVYMVCNAHTHTHTQKPVGLP